MTKEHGDFRKPLGAGGTHVVLTDLFEKNGAIPARRRANTGNHTDGHRQDEELPRVQPAGKAGDRHQPPQFADQELAADDVKEAGNRHHRHAQHDAPKIERRGAKQRQQQGQADRHEQPENKGGQRDGQRRPHARGDLAGDVAAVFGTAEVANEEARRLGKEDGFGKAPDASRLAVDE